MTIWWPAGAWALPSASRVTTAWGSACSDDLVPEGECLIAGVWARGPNDVFEEAGR